MATTSQGGSSGRHFHWTGKGGEGDGIHAPIVASLSIRTDPRSTPGIPESNTSRKKKLSLSGPAVAVAVSRLRSALLSLSRNRLNGGPHSLGPRVIGTLFGHRRGRVHFAFQREPTSPPAFLVELATPISGLVREMASGLVRIALECDKEKRGGGGDNKKPAPRRLIEEPVWRTFCNGKKCGFATRRECGEKELKVLKAVEPISMGTGVLPGDDDGGEGEVMYMRGKFERIVGSRDCEAFYMMNPDNNNNGGGGGAAAAAAAELCLYLLRL